MAKARQLKPAEQAEQHKQQDSPQLNYENRGRRVWPLNITTKFRNLTCKIFPMQLAPQDEYQ